MNKAHESLLELVNRKKKILVVGWYPSVFFLEMKLNFYLSNTDNPCVLCIGKSADETTDIERYCSNLDISCLTYYPALDVLSCIFRAMNNADMVLLFNTNDIISQEVILKCNYENKIIRIVNI